MQRYGFGLIGAALSFVATGLGLMLLAGLMGVAAGGLLQGAILLSFLVMVFGILTLARRIAVAVEAQTAIVRQFHQDVQRLLPNVEPVSAQAVAPPDNERVAAARAVEAARASYGV